MLEQLCLRLKLPILLHERGVNALLKTGQIVTSNYVITSTDGVVFTNGSAVTVSLPSAKNSGAGKQYAVKNINAAASSVNALGGTIEGTGQVTLGSNIGFTFTSDDINWWQL
jgi:hypothetical protein